MKPLVSIIIPVYNGSNYLREAIDSALAQTYDNLEILVVNDGSNDDMKTERIALSYGDKVRYISKENGGSSSALNLGIKSMKGAFFSWLSHDDLYLPEKIEKQVEAMSLLNENRMIVCCAGMLIDKNGVAMFHKTDKRQGLVSSNKALALLSHGNGINGCGVLISSSVLKQVGFFDEKMVYLNDLDYWWRTLLQDVDIFFMQDELVKTRIHNQQVSVTKRAMFNKERHYLAKKLLANVDYAKTDRLSALKQISYFCAAENLREEYTLAKEKMVTEGNLSIAMRLYLNAVWCAGAVKRFLKWIRKKVLFFR